MQNPHCLLCLVQTLFRSFRNIFQIYQTLFRSSGNFPDYPETFQIVRTGYFPDNSNTFFYHPDTFHIIRTHFVDYPDTFQIVRKLSRSSGHFPDEPDTFSRLSGHFYLDILCSTRTFSKLSGNSSANNEHVAKTFRIRKNFPVSIADALTGFF